MNATSTALPNTYHHPVLGGTGCFITSPKNLIRPVRSSNASTACLKIFLITLALPRRLFDRHRAGEDFDLSIAHADRILEQSARGRTGGHTTVGVIDASMTGAHEQVGLRQPSHGASEMRAV